MSLARVIEILEVVNEFYQDSVSMSLHPEALLLDDDTTVRDAIAEALSECLAIERSAEVKVSEVPKVPKSERRHYGKNYLGQWVGFVGKQRVIIFGTNEDAQERAAQWASDGSAY